MVLISRRAYEDLIGDGRVLVRDLFGPKVLMRSDQRIIKLFRVKRLLSLAFFYPYSLRFSRNARRLNAMGIRSVQVEQTFFCPSMRRHGVVYPQLEGQPLDRLLEGDEVNAAVVEALAAFIAKLHRKKIYFRSLHLGNVLLLPDGEFGLIDVADMRFGWLPLGLGQRRRNFRHLLRLPAHRAALDRFGLERFFKCYCQAAGYASDKWKFFHGV